jgi:hypothetical protein
MDHTALPLTAIVPPTAICRSTFNARLSTSPRVRLDIYLGNYARENACASQGESAPKRHAGRSERLLVAFRADELRSARETRSFRKNGRVEGNYELKSRT